MTCMSFDARLHELATSCSKSVGFNLCGVVSLNDESFEELAHFPGWIDDGRAGEMEYLKSRNESGELKRAHWKNAVPWARTAIVCALNYNSATPYSIENPDKSKGWIARYAWFADQDGKNTDYHDAILHRLRTVESRIKSEWEKKGGSDPLRTWCYVDTGPIVERVLARHAGLGWLGKNTCLLNEEIGSWLFLGVILLSAGISPAKAKIPADRCGTCTRCLDACPTGALTAPYQMDARLCISYLTIEKRGEIPEDLRAMMGRQVFGCDICQDVCPWNGAIDSAKRPPAQSAPEFQPKPELVNPPLSWLATMTREQFQQAFRGSPIKRAKYQGMRRNAAIAMGNSGNTDHIPVLNDLANDEDPVVAEHARWALRQLSSSGD